MSPRRTVRPAAARLRRLLVMLPWLMEQREVPVATMAERFGLTEAELVADLELASLCGLPPFVDEMIDVFIDDGTVFAGVPRVFTRPLRLTAPEGFALVAAGRAAMQLPGAERTGALGRALSKLAAALGDAIPTDAPAAGVDASPGAEHLADDVVVDLPRPPVTDDVSAAVAASERVRISYWTPARDELTEREITPRAVFAQEGHWYAVADDHRSGQERVFRLDRIDAWARTGTIDEARAVDIPAPGAWFADDPDLEVATLRLGPQARWIVERYPTRSVAEVDGATVVELAVTNERWLARLLVRLGPDGTLVEPPRWRGLAADAAGELLARYEVAAS